MNILIAAEFLGNIQDPNTYNSRFFTLADLLTDRGHRVHFVTTDFIHSQKRHVSGVTAYKDCKLTALREPGYPKNVCLRRFRSHYVLSQNLRKWLRSAEKPDVIYCAVPSLDFAYEAARFAKENDIPFVVDIQDLWPEAFELVFNVPVLSKAVFAPLRRRADYIYQAADRIVAVSETYAGRALRVNSSCENAEVVFLGTDLARFDPYRTEPLPLEKQDGDLWLCYVGTLGHSYDLKTVMDSMAILKDKPYYERITFVVAGDGPLRKDFEQYAEAKALNVHFTGMLPYPQMVALLCQCDIAVNSIVKKSAGTIINKHGDYAAAGIPVVNSQESPEYRALVEKYDMGFNCLCEDPADMAEKLDRLLEAEDLRQQMGKNARRCAEECFDRGKTYPKIVSIIEKL